MALIKKFSLVLFIVAIVLQRPGILGQLPSTGLLVKVTYLFTFILVLLFYRLKLTKESSKLIWSFLPVVFVFLFHAIIYKPSIVFNIGITVIFFVIPLILLFIVRRDKQIKIIGKTFLGIIVIISLSQVISQLLLLVGNLPLYPIAVPMGPDKVYNLYFVFPLSIIGYGSFNYEIFGITFPRSFGLFREPGLFQIFVIQSYFVSDYFKIKYTYLLKVILLLCLVSTFSTAGLILFAFCLLYKRVFIAKKNVTSLAASIVVIFSIVLISNIILFSETYTFSLANKLSGTSGLKRFFAIKDSFNALIDNPLWGVGMYSNIANVELSNVNFLGMIGQVGIIGSIALLCPFIYIGFKTFASRAFLLFIPLLATYLFSQPLFDKPITYFSLVFVFLLYEYEKKSSYFNYNSNL